MSVHARKEDGALEPMEFGIPQEPEFFMGGGGLYGTARDYIAFLQMLLHDGKVGGVQFLRPETIAEMSKNNMGDIKIAFLKTAIPSASPDVDLPQMFPGDDLKWGLSFLINTKQGPAGRSAGTSVLVRAGQYLFLGRSREARCRNRLHADTALRRSARHGPLHQVRKWCVPSGIVGPIASTTLLRPLLEAGAAQIEVIIMMGKRRAGGST